MDNGSGSGTGATAMTNIVENSHDEDIDEDTTSTTSSTDTAPTATAAAAPSGGRRGGLSSYMMNGSDTGFDSFFAAMADRVPGDSSSTGSRDSAMMPTTYRDEHRDDIDLDDTTSTTANTGTATAAAAPSGGSSGDIFDYDLAAERDSAFDSLCDAVESDDDADQYDDFDLDETELADGTTTTDTTAAPDNSSSN
jgi:hypothetical protein